MEVWEVPSNRTQAWRRKELTNRNVNQDICNNSKQNLSKQNLQKQKLFGLIFSSVFNPVRIEHMVHTLCFPTQVVWPFKNVGDPNLDLLRHIQFDSEKLQEDLPHSFGNNHSRWGGERRVSFHLFWGSQWDVITPGASVFENRFFNVGIFIF